VLSDPIQDFFSLWSGGCEIIGSEGLGSGLSVLPDSKHLLGYSSQMKISVLSDPIQQFTSLWEERL
jgi:hypothetical protein